MIEKDTVRLLRECDAGVNMGISSIDEVSDHIKNKEFKELLENCRTQHDKLNSEIQQLLDKYQFLCPFPSSPHVGSKGQHSG